MPDGFSSNVRMDLAEFDQYVQLVADARQAWKDRVDVRLGLEADYFQGYETFLERQLASADFHYVLGSVHPQIAEFRQRHWRGDAFQFQKTYFDQLAASAETGLFDCLAHPDLVKNETADQWDFVQLEDVVGATLDRIAKTGVAMELNTSGLRKRVPQMNPCPEMLTMMCRRNIPVVIGADAHQPQRVGDQFGPACELLERCGYTHVSYFLDRSRREAPISLVRDSLRDAELC